MILLLTSIKAEAHGGNITGWKEKNSDKIVKQNGTYYGYHKQDGKRHYHEVAWNEQKEKWEISKTAVYYDENFQKIDGTNREQTEKVEAEFLQKVDGDTAKFDLNGEKITVRFLGIDTPETVHPTKKEEPFGKEASEFTEERLKNALKIELEYDRNASKTDQYERHLAWIWVDGALLQEELIQNGLAKTYMLQDNYQYAGNLQEAQQNAKTQRLGIWSDVKIEGNDKEKTEEKSDITIETVLLGVLLIIGMMIKILKKR